ncbi:DGQHR domain-containing protein [Aurantivibrio plasticivorans]
MNRSIKIPAHNVKQPIGEFFVASIKAQDLVDISYSDVRRMEGNDGKREVERYLGIQRPLKASRVKEIRSYILNDRDATFPTSIILAVDERCVEFDEEKGTLCLYPYSPEEDSTDTEIEFHQIAKVLDGQHRIAGFFQGDGSTREFDYENQFDINVSIFVGIDLPEQAKIFATVNLAQTKVNKSLVYDLEDLARKRNPFKTCHHVAVALDANEDSPFYQRIKRLGVATPGRDYEPLTQASFVESLVRFISDDPARDRNLILDGKKLKEVDHAKHPFNILFREGEKGDLKIYEIIYNYFNAVREKWPEAWDQKQRSGNLLPKSNAFKALMRYLKNDVYCSVVGDDIGRVPTVAEFLESFSHVQLTDSDFTTKNFTAGSGGESKFYKVLNGSLDASELYS